MSSSCSYSIAERFRKDGNEAFKARDYKRAQELYSQAIHHNPNCPEYFGNRSATRLMLQDYPGALEDSITSTKLDENFTKVVFVCSKIFLLLNYS